MKLMHYIRYFFYIGFNWNFQLALFTIYHEVTGEKKYGIDTSKLNDLTKLSVKGDTARDAEIYQGANYFLLENLFKYLQNIHVNNNLVDFGCGKGRVLVVAAFFGFAKITGIEFALELCALAKQNIIRAQSAFPEKIFHVLHLNAIDYVIENDSNVFFFFNPFNEIIMLAVVKNILSSLKTNEREIYVVYINPVHKEIFLSAGFEEIYSYQKMYYVHGTILKKSPGDSELFQ